MNNSINSILRSAAQQFIVVSDTPRLDAEVLLMHVLGVTRAQLLARGEQDLSDVQLQAFQTLITRRQIGEPIAYIIGYREFWSLTFAVTRDTLIPRPETELLVELALNKFPADQAISVADLGTGCGAIALAIAYERSVWQVMAIDRVAEVLSVAKYNAKHLQIDNVEFCLGNWCDALGSKQYQLIVSNPPYIRNNDEHLLQGDVRFEPHTALAAGEDGLQDLQGIIACAGKNLLPKGWLLLEHGFDQAEAVRELMLARGFQAIVSYQDLSGKDRVTIGCNQ